MRTASMYPVVVLAGLLSIAVGGCPAGGLDAQSTKAAGESLAGTWKASEAAGGAVNTIQITIDDTNALTNIHVAPPPGDLPVAAGTLVQVNGAAVEFATDFPLGVGSMSFQGTLNAPATTMTGSLTVRTTAGSPAEDTAPVVFVRQ